MIAEFFVVALPGLEDIVLAEVREWYPALEPVVGHGGVTVTCPVDVGLSFNATLKTATRVLLRLARFRARDFPKLHRTVADLPWARYLEPNARVTVHASARGSRLKIKTRIEDTVAKGFDAYRARAKAKADGGKVDLFARLLDDECTLSLDTSGERLHKRGVRTLIGEAPLRETIAAALFRLVRQHAAPAAAARIEVVDPMAGSGTFLIEAATSHAISTSRDYAVIKGEATLPSTPPGPNVISLIGFERDAETARAARQNLSAVATAVDFKNADIFSADPLPNAAAGVGRWLLVNPPYGERLKITEPLPAYYAKLFAACERVARPDVACALLPATAKGRLDLPIGWRVLEKRAFVNGGIPVVAYVFGRRS